MAKAKQLGFDRNIPQLSARLVIPLLDELNEQGVDTAVLLESLGTRLSDVLSAPFRLPLAVASALWDAALRIGGDPAVGLKVAANTDPRVLELFWYLLATSVNVRQALQHVSRYSRLLDESHAFTVAREGRYVVVRCVLEPGQSRPAVLTENTLATLLLVLRKITATPLLPAAVDFRHARLAATAAYRELFGGPVRFGRADDALIFAAAALDLPCVGADPILGSVLERNTLEYLDLIPRLDSLSDRVRSLIRSMLPRNVPSERDVAAMLCMSTRTLRRYLSGEGTSFREISDVLRCEMAVHDLCELGRSIDEVADSLGFSDASSFHQAFRRWTGVTPAQYKKTRQKKRA